MRPKALVGSSGTVWSSEDFEFRANRPDLYEVSNSTSSYSLAFRSFCARVKDKVKPGTSVGFRGTRRGGIYQQSDSNVARKLPKYEWVKEEVCVTPSTHRIFTKEPRVAGDKEAYVMSEKCVHAT